ncbi:hypothetical protein [Chromobacterium subtsugae]|uniref:hypothetical protein n=1 Tax=Chromobacterium subtsugae TaxID=251747 RepID=UPI000B31B525|nr:hypothetical protein [Chromobacterium subtsugae]
MKPQGMSGWGRRVCAGLGLLLFCLQARAAADEDCGRAVAPQRCLLHQQGLRSCLDLAESRRRACLSYYTPPLSCQRQRDAKRCEALLAAQASCEGMTGASRRQCVDERLPAGDCPRSAQPCPKPLPLAD